MYYYAIVQKEEVILTTTAHADRETAIQNCMDQHEVDYNTIITFISESYQAAQINEKVIIECTDDIHTRHQAGEDQPFFFIKSQNIIA